MVENTRTRVKHFVFPPSHTVPIWQLRETQCHTLLVLFTSRSWFLFLIFYQKIGVWRFFCAWIVYVSCRVVMSFARVFLSCCWRRRRKKEGASNRTQELMVEGAKDRKKCNRSRQCLPSARSYLNPCSRNSSMQCVWRETRGRQQDQVFSLSIHLIPMRDLFYDRESFWLFVILLFVAWKDLLDPKSFRICILVPHSCLQELICPLTLAFDLAAEKIFVLLIIVAHSQRHTF